ncbi:hypothetical protein PT974_08696 [Cladobotryum mycophilum]|uniref:Trafficking protein particle complex II-specific subunit 65 IgD3 domain-containing protein n=1 Tax=Cladobotryum mycophilum TaxID=491253 RepID=A0ABR0SE22_9HYPO
MSDHDVAPDEDVPEFQVTIEPSDSFVDESYLTYLVPSETDIDLEAALSDHDKTKPILESIPQRDTLFFDETVDVLLVLRTPWLPKKELDSYINRLTIALEAHVVNEGVPGRDSTIVSESIFSGRLQDVADPFIVVEEQESSDSEEEPVQNIYAMWKFPVVLGRPRMRLHSPSIVFSASASLKPETGSDLYSPGSGYLPSGLPSGFNLLESFASDPSLNGIKPRLSALRVSRVAPVTRQQDLMTRLRALPQLSVRVFPVLHTRIRFSRSSTAPISSALIALLEVDFTPNFNCEALLDEIRLSTNEATIENLNDEAGLKLPLSCVSHDHVTFLYRITPLNNEITSKNAIGTLDISISTTINVIPNVCTPRLTMTWNTVLDFSHSINPIIPTAAAAAAAADTGGSIQRPNRPARVSTASTSSQVVKPLQSPSSIRPDALPVLEASTNRTDAIVPDLGITMSFTAPSGPIHPGDIFSWTVYVVNRTVDKTRITSGPPPSTASPRHGEKEIADAVMDENILHALQRNAAVEATDLICLSADTRVGPVAPGACHVVELQFLALREGIVGLDAIRVVDLNSQEHVDIRDLPTMIVVPVAA